MDRTRATALRASDRDVAESCPRLTIWEDAVDLGYVTRGHDAMVVVTEQGRKLLRAHGRPG